MKKSLSKFIDNFLTTNQMKMIMGGYGSCTARCYDGSEVTCGECEACSAYDAGHSIGINGDNGVCWCNYGSGVDMTRCGTS